MSRATDQHDIGAREGLRVIEHDGVFAETGLTGIAGKENLLHVVSLEVRCRCRQSNVATGTAVCSQLRTGDTMAELRRNFEDWFSAQVQLRSRVHGSICTVQYMLVCDAR